MNRLVLAASLLAVPVFARAQSYECADALARPCRTAIHDGFRTEGGDDRSGSATSTLLVLPGACPQEDRIVDVDLGVHVLHPYVGDLEVELAHPDGTTVAVLYRPGIGAIEGNCPNDDLEVSFDDDDGVKGFEMCRPTIPALRDSVLPFNPLSLLDGKARNGTWTLTVRDHVPGNEGVLLGWKLDLPCVPDLPDVTLDTTDAVVSERGPDDRAVVTVARGGDTANVLEVRYRVTGSASLTDFEPLPGMVRIAAGASAAALEIRAVPDDDEERDETIVVTLLPGADYELGARDSAFVTLIERSDAPAADGGESRAGAGGSDETGGGSGGAAGRGGGSGGNDDPRDGGTAGRSDVREKDEGCDCRLAGTRANEPPLGWLALAALMCGIRLRRRKATASRS